MSEITQLTCSSYYQPLMQPIPGEHPCGESLDYNPEFILLQSQLQPKLDVEYGDFFEAAEPINWTEIERNCLTLLQKSKDIRLIIILTRCRLRKVGILALAEGLETLYALLNTWPNELYPQLLDEGDFAPELRAYAFAELENANGLLADFRNQTLPRASGLQITVKEFEKAHQVPREEGALSDATVTAIINDWALNARDEIAPLSQARHYLREIKKNLNDTLEHETPELEVLEGLLGYFATGNDDVPQPVNRPAQAAQPAAQGEPIASAPSQPARQASLANAPSARLGIQNRADALQRLQEVREWFAMAEPSSPLTLMLQYAEASIGKSFADLIKMYPTEIISVINQEKE